MDYINTQIINNSDGIEVNKDIESKIKILNNGMEEKLIFTKKFDKTGMNVIYFSIQNKLNDLSFLFNNCSTLKAIDFISFETDNVTNMKVMFQSCHKLENLNLTYFNTSKVTNMTKMFNCCNKLKQIIGINNFDTSKITNMKDMFKSCSELEYLDLTNFNITNVIDIFHKESIFNECNKLKQINGGEKFNKKQNNIKPEISNLLTKNSFDEKSVKSNNSYHGFEYQYDNNVDESFHYSSYNNKEKEEKKFCRFCGETIDSKSASPLYDSYHDNCYDPGD